jgi:hypothetical protein
MKSTQPEHVVLGQLPTRFQTLKFTLLAAPKIFTKETEFVARISVEHIDGWPNKRILYAGNRTGCVFERVNACEKQEILLRLPSCDLAPTDGQAHNQDCRPQPPGLIEIYRD